MNKPHQRVRPPWSPSDPPQYLGRGWLARTFDYLRETPAVAVCAVLLLCVLTAAALAGPLAPFSPDAGDLNSRLHGPSATHLLGTDQVGRDVFSRLIHGARSSVMLGLGAALLAQLVAVVIGVSTGYFGGWYDFIVQRFLDVWIALPGLLLLIFVTGVAGQSYSLVLITTALLLSAGSARVVRSVTMALRHQGYLEAARGVGCGWPRLLLRHALPNLLPLILVHLTVQAGAAVLLESSLSFLGFGVPGTTLTWGRMLADARAGLTQPGGFNLALWPGLAITLTVYAFTTVGDGLVDLLDLERRTQRRPSRRGANPRAPVPPVTPSGG